MSVKLQYLNVQIVDEMFDNTFPEPDFDDENVEEDIFVKNINECLKNIKTTLSKTFPKQENNKAKFIKLFEKILN